jgi:HEAT repeat protein
MSAAALYDALVLSVLIGVAGTLSLVLYTLLHHAVLSLSLARKARRGSALLPILCRAIGDPSRRDDLISEISPSDRALLLPLLLQLALDLRGEESQTIATLAEELGISTHERQRLRSRSGIERAEAVKNLGLLRAAAALPELLHLVTSDRQPTVRTASAWAIGEIGGRKAVLGLLSMLEDRDPSVVRRAQEVLLRAAPDAAPEVVSFARRTDDPRARCAAIEVLGALRDPFASDLLAELVETHDAELRTKVIKAAAAMADSRFLESFRKLLRDPAWSVRCQAANGLGAIGTVDAIPDLCSVLDDEAWWVRFNAASALSEFGTPGRAALAEATMSEDERRRGVAEYVLLRTRSEQRAA